MGNRARVSASASLQQKVWLDHQCWRADMSQAQLRSLEGHDISNRARLRASVNQQQGVARPSVPSHGESISKPAAGCGLNISSSR
eukprot:1160745-Pelagomonas_calceolata.AAC.11